MRILVGLSLFAIGMIIDACSQVKRFLQGGYLDDELRRLVLGAIWKFTIGFGIVFGLIYFFRILFR